MPAFRAEWRAVKQANKARLAALVQARLRRRLRPRRPVRCAGQTHPRIQAPTAQRAARDPPLRPHQARRHGRLDAALRADRRQGRAGLRDGQAHHQADQQRGRGGQRRPGRDGLLQAGLPAQLPGVGDGSDLPRHRPVRADFHRRQGSLRHRQHEIHDERRAHHRHAGRRQHRNPRGSGRGELLPVRPHRRRSGRHARATTIPPRSSPRTRICAA